MTDPQTLVDNAGTNEQLESLFARDSFELPLLSDAASKLLSLCSDADCSPKELLDNIRRDQAIATHVLRVSNSAMYSAGVQIVSLQQAVVRLGLQRIREIVLVVTCQSRIFSVSGYEAEVRDSFKNSLATAGFAQEIARTRRASVEDAFLCGLLHDIGRPVLLQATVDFEAANRITFTRDEVLQTVETHRIAVGSRLIEEWNLPGRASDAVLQQNGSATDDRSDEAKQLQLAIGLSKTLLVPTTEDFQPFFQDPLVESLNIYPDQLQAILDQGEKILDLIGSTQ